MIFSKKTKLEFVKLIYNYFIKFVKFIYNYFIKSLFRIILILCYCIFVLYICSGYIWYSVIFGLVCALAIVFMVLLPFKVFPFFICITEGDILKYLDNLDKKGENDKLYLIYKINEKSLPSLSSFKSYCFAIFTIISLLLIFTDKFGFNIEKFSKMNINYIFNYRFIFIANSHFWFFIALAGFYYWCFIFIRRRNISKIFFKYFDLQSFKRNDVIEPRSLNMKFKHRKHKFNHYLFVLRNIRHKTKKYVPKHLKKNRSHKL